MTWLLWFVFMVVVAVHELASRAHRGEATNWDIVRFAALVTTAFFVLLYTAGARP